MVTGAARRLRQAAYLEDRMVEFLAYRDESVGAGSSIGRSEFYQLRVRRSQNPGEVIARGDFDAHAGELTIGARNLAAHLAHPRGEISEAVIVVIAAAKQLE
jgi:hypothetical protein